MTQQQMKTHIIHWKSTLNGRIGAGTFLFEKEDAERLAEELNLNYPAIQHQAVCSPNSEIQQANVGASPER